MNTKIKIWNQNKYFILLTITLALIESIGPIIFNIEQGLTIKHIFSTLCFALFFASGIVSIIGLLGKKSCYVFIITYIVYTIFSYINLLYHRAFEMYLPIKMVFEFQQLDGLGGSIFALLRWYDIAYFCICASAIIGILYYRREHFLYKHHIAIGMLCIITTGIPVFFITNKVLKWKSLHQCIKSFEWTCSYNPVTCYKGFGLLPIIGYQLDNTMTPTPSLTEAENAEINQIVQENNQLVCNSEFDIIHKKNVVIILMESLNSICISPTLMPTLDDLSHSNTTLFCPRVKQLSQAAASIGGQFVVLTGLNGLRQSVFVTDYPRNKYPSIVTEMSKGNNTYSYTVISTHRLYWRQNTVSDSIGMMELFEQNKDIHHSAIERNVWGWDDDKIVFEKTVNNLPTDNRPFCALIIPSNMHSPYTYDTSIKCDATFPEIQDASLHEYMRRAKYVDEQIATFIQSLKDKGVYDDTLIVITSDHQVPDAYSSDAMRQTLSPYIPAIFINTGADWTEQNKRNKDVVFCHSQVYPTMLQLMGLRPDGYAGLFPPMTNIEATQEYDFDNCDYATTTDERLKRIYDLEEKIIRSSYFGVMK